MSLLTNIVAPFKPRPVAAVPAPATPPVTGSRPVQPDMAPERTAEPQPAAAMPVVPANLPIAAPDVASSTPPAASNKASTVQEIALHQFAAVHLRPAAAPLPAALAEAIMSAPTPATEQPQPEPAVQTASVYAQAIAQLMEERGSSARQQIMQLL